MSDREHVRQDLVEQLKANHVHGSHFHDLVEQYMRFWDLDVKLTSFIEEEGPMVLSGTGFKANPAIDARNKNSTQMLKIIATLGVNVKQLSSNTGGDDDGYEAGDI